MPANKDTKSQSRSQSLREAALHYHQFPYPGKLKIVATKELSNQLDLALAYSPGVAEPCLDIEKDPAAAYKYTNKGNLVAVVSNGTAVLGLGDIGPLAAKPVMEGKAVLFKKFSNIDVFDIEVKQQDSLDKLVDVIAALEPTFGGINLEDIKAPDCFYVEEKLRERMNIPVFHDDQHGTAIVVSAAITNALKLIGKDIAKVKLVASGAGAASISCLNLLITLGLERKNITVIDGGGVIYKGRQERMTPVKEKFAQDTTARTLAEAMVGADVFLGLSAAGVVSREMAKSMAAQPIIMALANPKPEILPEEVKAVRDDAIIGTGRSDYPNQVNNVLCFPYIFRGALDCGATTINAEMQAAAVQAIAELAQAEPNEVVAQAYLGESLEFGPEYLIPKPFDPRLMIKIAPAVAKAAEKTGVASRPITDWKEYHERLESIVYKSGNIMRPIFTIAKAASKKRIVFAEGESEKVLRAIQLAVDEKIATPILVGRADVIAQNIVDFGLKLKAEIDYEVFDTNSDSRFNELCQKYHQLAARKGVNRGLAKARMSGNKTLVASMLVHEGYADGMICGSIGITQKHISIINDIIGKKSDATLLAAMSGSLVKDELVFIADTYVNYEPTAEQIAEITLLAANEMKRLGIRPRVALLSHSNFGTIDTPKTIKMRKATQLVKQLDPELEVDGEMHADLAFNIAERNERISDCKLVNKANLLITPDVDSAHIAQNLLRATTSSNITIGPILLGANKKVHLLTPSSTVRRILNMTAITVADINAMEN